MKSLKDYINECDGTATPASTMGMGNPMPPGENGEPGSGDTFTAKALKDLLKRT